jgi:propionate CoA-transferase
MELTEIAPGIDLGKDILPWMDFKPVVKKDSLRLMDGRIFKEEPMGLREDLLTLLLEDRLTYDPAENIFFVNFEGYTVKSTQQIHEIKEAVERILLPLGKKVYTIVNYDNFAILPDLVEEYTEMVKDLVNKYYSEVTRYTTSTFLRMKLGDAMQKRNLAPHIYESSTEARKALLKE